MRVLVIGGTLFIGRELVNKLVARGHDVTVLHRRDVHDLGPEVRNVQADRRDLEAVTRIVSAGRFDVIVDMVYDWANGTPAGQVEATARAGGGALQRYLFMSSIAAYGPGLDHREGDPLVADDVPNVYARDKAASERALFRLHAETGVPVTTFRPPFVHGPRQPFYREQFFWDRLRDKRPIILPDGGHSPIQFVYVGDLAEACVRALDLPTAAGEAFNIAHTEALTQRSWIDALGRAAGVAPTFVSVPRDAIRSAGGHPFAGNLYFGEFLDMPVHTSVVEKAPRVLGITPTSLDAALAAGFAWYSTERQRPVDYSFEDRVLASAG
jgi:nucleoside-diphosphate-sugar epimerase